MKLPKRILVTVEEPDLDDEYLQVNTDPEDAATVGVVKNGGWYVLESKVTVTAKTEVSVTVSK